MLPSLFFPLLFKKIFIRKFERFWKIGDEDIHYSLLKLNRSGRLTGNIIHYPIHMTHLIDDPAGHLL